MIPLKTTTAPIRCDDVFENVKLGAYISVCVSTVPSTHKNTIRIKVNKVMKIVDLHDEY